MWGQTTAQQEENNRRNLNWFGQITDIDNHLIQQLPWDPERDLQTKIRKVIMDQQLNNTARPETDKTYTTEAEQLISAHLNTYNNRYNNPKQWQQQLTAIRSLPGMQQNPTFHPDAFTQWNINKLPNIQWHKICPLTNWQPTSPYTLTFISITGQQQTFYMPFRCIICKEKLLTPDHLNYIHTQQACYQYCPSCQLTTAVQNSPHFQHIMKHQPKDHNIANRKAVWNSKNARKLHIWHKDNIQQYINQTWNIGNISTTTEQHTAAIQGNPLPPPQIGRAHV